MAASTSVVEPPNNSLVNGTIKAIVKEHTSDESSISDTSVEPSSPPTHSAMSNAEKQRNGHGVEDKDTTTAPAIVRKKKVESLEERGRVPSSFYVTIIVVVMLQGCSGMYNMGTLRSWWSSFTTSAIKVRSLLQYEKELMQSIFAGDLREPNEYLVATVVSILVGSIMWVLLGVPFRAGLWTSKERRNKHTLHRYFGLFFLIQYALSWVEFITNYHGVGEFSFLPHTVALNGYTAYFSFKVLPHLKDAGYYSDRGVMSRDFLHENICFNLFCVFGAVYNHSELRQTLQSNLGGRLIEIVFVFFPFVAVRPWFPTTRIKNTGKAKTRSEQNRRFYEIGTLMFKIFYLWAKYFLGFQLNFMIFLGKVKPENVRFMQGLHLLNTGTVAIAMFLHTMRFRKILPAKFTFGFYICQIYATFTALPYAIDTFVSHPKLALLSLSGLLCNMTRNLNIHTAWCFGALVLLTCTSIDW